MNPYLTADLIRESYQKLRKKAAVGVDGKTAAEYGMELGARLSPLIEEIKGGSYRALPARRGYIPKPGKEEKRPLGIPTVCS